MSMIPELPDDDDAAPVEIPDHPDNDKPRGTELAEVEIPDHPDNDKPRGTELAEVETFADVPGGPEAELRAELADELREVEPAPEAELAAADERPDVTGPGDPSSPDDYATQEAALLEPGREKISTHASSIPADTQPEPVGEPAEPAPELPDDQAPDVPADQAEPDPFA